MRKLTQSAGLFGRTVSQVEESKVFDLFHTYSWIDL